MPSRPIRLWILLTVAWAIISLLLAPWSADTLWDDSFATTIFFWVLLISASLVPLVHQFIGSEKRYRRLTLIALSIAGLVFAISLYGINSYRSPYTREIFWIPIVWVAILVISDKLFITSRLGALSQPATDDDVKMRLRSYANRNTDRTVNAFKANVEEFRDVFLDECHPDATNVQIGTLSTDMVKDFLATKFGLEASLVAFHIVFSRIFEDPKQSKSYPLILEKISKKRSEVRLPNEADNQPYLVNEDFEKISRLLENPKYSGKMDELRLAIAINEMFVGTQLKPILAEENEREKLMRLMKRTLNRMRDCLQK